MGDAIKRSVTTTAHRYELRTPTNAVEVAKAIDWASRDLRKWREVHAKNPTEFDDDLTVDSDEETVIIYWTEPRDV